MSDCRFADFDLAIQGHTGPYSVRAQYAGHSAEGELTLDAPELAAFGVRMGGARPNAAHLLPHGRSQLEGIGAQLFTLLWRDQVRDLWLKARSETEAAGVGLRLRLSLSPAPAAALPWELSYDPERRTFLAATPRTLVVRTATLLRYVGQPRALAARLPLTVVAAIPEDPTGQYDAAVEAQTLEQALWPLLGGAGQGSVRLVTLGGRLTLTELRERLAQERADVLHLITHGQGDGVVLWQDDQPILAPATALKLALEGAPALRLAVLSACSTAQAVEQSPLASLGAQLLQTGVPAVVAMQFDVRTTAVAHFAEQFYTHLLAGACPGAVDVAMNYARSSLLLHDPEALDFATPVLWLNAQDGYIVKLSGPVTLRARPAPPPVFDAAEAQVLLEEVATLRAWLLAEPTFDRTTLAPAARPIDAGRQERIQAMRDLLDAVARGQTLPAQAELARRHLPALRAHREHVERLTAILRANARPPAS